jgi:hypothetical protein
MQAHLEQVALLMHGASGFVRLGNLAPDGSVTDPGKPAMIGGAGRDRTGDLIVANDALSQLSYSPLYGMG